MGIDLPQMIKEAQDIEFREFMQLIEEAVHLLAEEDGQVGDLNVIGRLIKLEHEGEAVIVSDIHGHLESLMKILKDTDFLRIATRRRKTFLIFLGDYGDRGAHSVEVYHVVLRLKLLYPKQVILMRGNHEGPEDLLAYPHDLPTQLRVRFGRKWKDIYHKIQKLFQHLYNAVLVKERYLIIHGGLPQGAKTLEDLAFAHTRHPEETMLEEMLWSDPVEINKGTSLSPRGAGRLFGEDITAEVLSMLNVSLFIRGHEPCPSGFKINHDGKIITLFSRKGPPYFNVQGAYLHLDLSSQMEIAEQLIPYIRVV
ncbi:serine/threonine protein phosphatase [Candidatus Bathyarchaeota archaeon]|nr:serine/threonine protein phosphatase [Candidatus Bathyarchaeota archaeon]